MRTAEAERGSIRSNPVAAIVVSFNRRDTLRRVLGALQAQTHSVDEIVVVDNASTDGAHQMLLNEFPQVTTIALEDNEGPGASFGRGMGYAYAQGHRWAWLFNDDDLPAPEALETLLAWSDQLSDRRLGMIGCWVGADDSGPSGGGRWKARPCPQDVPATGGRPYETDLLLFSGTLVSLDTVPSVGVPRDDYFFMMEEYEFCLRMSAAGQAIMVVPEPLVASFHLGSTRGASPPWRGYYQTRNYLAMTLDRGSSKEVLWCLVREAKAVIGAVALLDRKWERARLRLLGAGHAFARQTGKTLDPETGLWTRGRKR